MFQQVWATTPNDRAFAWLLQRCQVKRRSLKELPGRSFVETGPSCYWDGEKEAVDQIVSEEVRK